ncbi:hypothetical protein ATCC90586_007263 [Pythium insidiosum]|nr:hypothetical protein ATCC90586_007263 [Pythium insidiosum]
MVTAYTTKNKLTLFTTAQYKSKKEGIMKDYDLYKSVSAKSGADRVQASSSSGQYTNVPCTLKGLMEVVTDDTPIALVHGAADDYFTSSNGRNISATPNHLLRHFSVKTGAILRKLDGIYEIKAGFNSAPQDFYFNDQEFKATTEGFTKLLHDEESRDIILKPGDVMYLKPIVYHAVQLIYKMGTDPIDRWCVIGGERRGSVARWERILKPFWQLSSRKNRPFHFDTELAHFKGIPEGPGLDSAKRKATQQRNTIAHWTPEYEARMLEEFIEMRNRPEYKSHKGLKTKGWTELSANLSKALGVIFTKGMTRIICTSSLTSFTTAQYKSKKERIMKDHDLYKSVSAKSGAEYRCLANMDGRRTLVLTLLGSQVIVGAVCCTVHGRTIDYIG